MVIINAPELYLCETKESHCTNSDNARNKNNMAHRYNSPLHCQPVQSLHAVAEIQIHHAPPGYEKLLRSALASGIEDDIDTSEWPYV